MFNFNDPLLSSKIIIIWVIMILILFYKYKVIDKKFLNLSIDKNSKEKVLGMRLNNKKTVYLLILYSFFAQLISEYSYTSLSPWINNNLQNDNVKELKYSRNQILFMTNSYNLFIWVNYVIGIFLIMSQKLIFILPRIIGSFIVFNFSNLNYMKNKNLNPIKI